MSEKISHEAVVSSLMDLQARLRGDGGQESARRTAVVTEETQELVHIALDLPKGATVEDALSIQKQANKEEL